MNSKDNMKKFWLYLLVSIVAGGLAAYFVTSYQLKHNPPYIVSQKVIGTDSTGKKVYAPAATSTDFTEAAEMAVKGVVYVKVTTRKMSQPNSILDLFFGFVPTPQDQIGIGSGVIISSDGYIVTNNHVIDGANKIQVTLEDNEVFDAKLVGTDVPTDVALLKIDAKNLPTIPFGDSDNLKVGEWVLAIGSPYDMRSTITAGIVSAKGRTMPNYDGQFKVESFIQTDAAVNPGNSGGALVNTRGELVGINTSIVSMTGSYAGYSFAVPVSIVRKVTDDIIKFGEVHRAKLGISMTDITPDLQEKYDITAPDGVLVMGIDEGPALRAGIHKGDVITEIDLKKVGNTAGVQDAVNRHSPGEEILLTVIRDKQQKEIVVHL
jgi:Trypsin-like serine proteases, typically periplasmic, contain C-terminal PDZ domain